MNYIDFINDRYVGQTVHVVGSGPSLRGFDYSLLTGKMIIAINHAYKEVPQFDFKVALDRTFFTREDTDAVNHGWTMAPHHAAQDSRIINFRMAAHFSTDPGPVYAYGSSGLAAVSMALQGAAERVVLWGLDYCFADGIHHATQGKYMHSQGDGREHVFQAQASKFAAFPVEKIVNASSISGIQIFRKVSVEEAISL